MTTTFIEYVAKDIINKHGNDLSRIAVVFPNKRASLFMNNVLAHTSQSPIWSPSYITISDLFRKHSKLTVGDPIKLICDLYKSYTKCTGIDEPLDRFYSWGQLLISDFDDVDKNMADADKVFQNLSDYHGFDNVDYLDEEQVKMLKEFFSNFAEDQTSRLKEKFLHFWGKINDIYHDFNKRLNEEGLAYEGALYRKVATDENINFNEYDAYIFVGFNMLQKVEQQLFKRLKKQGKAYFYWDFDQYYMKKQSEAGHYISQYLSDFPNELDNKEDSIYNNFNQKKNISYISATTEDIQARYVSTWLRQGNRIKDGKRTAVILCDENLLPSIIHCLPPEIDKVNVTTGYPLCQTPIAAKVTKILVKMLHSSSNIQLSNLSSQLMDEIKKIAEEIKQDKKESNVTDSLTEESLFRTYTLLNRLNDLITNGDLDVDVITYQRLVNQLIRQTSIPFHGEPAVGIQIMGVLETRNLDFDHILLLSCNEGNMPKGVDDSSFIPHSIRKAYDLTTIDNKIAIYAYYFHSLLQRASDITICYNNSTEDGHTGEMSRFMLQMMVESGQSIDFHTLKAGQIPTTSHLSEIPKTQKVLKTLYERFSGNRQLSPTAINKYQRCQLQFYYYYICGINDSQDIDEDKAANRLFGDIFHKAAQLVYEPYISKKIEIEKTDIEYLLKNRINIERAVDEATKTVYQNNKLILRDNTSAKNGLQLINRAVLISYIRQLLQIDLRLAPLSILKLEYNVATTYNMKTDNGIFPLTIGGSIDRMDFINPDKSNPCIRIIDYKTGAGRFTSLKTVDDIFDKTKINNHNDYYLQTFIYSTIVSQSKIYNPQNFKVSPALLFIQHAGAKDYDPTLKFGNDKIEDISDFSQEFTDNLHNIIDEIFDSQKSFIPTDNQDICKYCPYAGLCGF